jgi:hypothetical protein
LDNEFPQLAIDALAMELYAREKVDLEYLAENDLNNTVTIEEYPEMELLLPSFNTEWVDSAKVSFLDSLKLDSSQLSNYEPNYFNHLVANNSLKFASIVTEVYEQTDERENGEDYIKKFFSYKPIPGISLKSMLELVTSNE